MGKLRPFVQKESYMPNKKWIPFVIGNGYTTVDGASGPAPEWDTAIGNPVSFNALTPWPLRQLQVAFSPVQSLNGYDAPWPAGGGKNLLYQMPTTSQTINDVAWSINADGSITANGTANGDSTFLYIPSTDGIGYSFDGDYKYKNFGYVSASIMNIGIKIGDVWKTVFSNSYSDVSDVHGQIKQMWFQIRNGQTADNITIYPLICKASETEPTAWTPYSNICPISGWSSLTVEQRGKNLLQKSIEQIDNVAKELASCFFVKAGTYTVSFASANNATSWRFAVMMRDADGNNLSDTGHKPSPSMSWNAYGQVWLLGSNTTDKSITLTFVDDCYIRIVLAVGDTSTSTTVTDGMLELGSTASSYTPYNPSSRSISISLGSTVYSGYVDVISGVGEITGISVVYDGSEDEPWLRHTGGSAGAFAMSVAIDPNLAYPFTTTDAIRANYLKTLMTTDTWGLYSQFISANTNGSLKTGIKTIDTVEAWREYLASNPLQVYYDLETPIPIQLTPQEVQSLLGVNNMWSDANGNLTVEYRSN